MQALLGVIAAAVMRSIVYLVVSERRRALMRAWRGAAEQAGLTGIRGSEGFFTGGSVLARSGQLTVRLEECRGDESGTAIVVTGLGHGPAGLSLRREGLGTAIEKRFVGEGEIEIGDASFDEEYFVQGQRALALAILDSETRRSVAALVRNRIPTAGHWVDVQASLGNGALKVVCKESGFSDERESLPDVLVAVLDVARRLVAPPDLAARIAENVRTESSVGARVQSLRVLAREFPHHPATRDALLEGCQDPSPEVRLCSGTALGQEGWPTLLSLIEDAGTADACAARAIAALRHRLAPERAEAALRRALGGGWRTSRPETARASLETLALLKRTEAEGLMLQALRSTDGQVAAAAVRALGRAGTVAAVPALREIADAGGDMGRAARQAVAEIHARLTGAEPGQLTLAGGEAGALSLADESGEPGRLSLAEAPGVNSAEGDEGSTLGPRTKPKRSPISN